MTKRILMIAVIALVAVSAFAQGAPAPAPTKASTIMWSYIAAAFVLGIAAAAGAIGQAKAIASSVEGIARNPSAGAAIRGAMIIGLALIESLVIYALVIAFTIVIKG